MEVTTGKVAMRGAGRGIKLVSALTSASPMARATGAERMPARTLNWKSKDGLAVGKGATVQSFVSTVRGQELQIDVTPWGEGHLKVNGRQVAQVNDAKDKPSAISRNPRSASYRSGHSNPQAKGLPP
jgi:hypothetical protein